jgi:hypothetical protein
MFATFFRELKQAGVPVTPREYLTRTEAIEKASPVGGSTSSTSRAPAGDAGYTAKHIEVLEGLEPVRLHDTTRSIGSAISPAIRCCVS